MLDEIAYGNLLTATLPQVIETDEECVRVEKIVADLLNKKSPSPEEDKLLDLLSDLIEAYEDKVYVIEKGDPHRMLRSLIEQNGLRQNDLLTIFGSSGVASEVINGKRSISKAQAKKLADFFKVSADLFI